MVLPTKREAWQAGMLAFVAGVSWVQWMPQLPDATWLWGLPLLLGAPWMLPLSWRNARWLATVLIWLAMGIGWASLRATERLADYLPVVWSDVPVVVTGLVTDMPVKTTHGVRFPFDIDAVLTPGAQIPHHVQLALLAAYRHPLALPAILPGQRWRWTITLRAPRASENPHVPDAESIWFAEDVRAFGRVQTNAGMSLLANRSDTWAGTFNRWRLMLAQQIDAWLPGQPYAGVLKALTVGDQSDIPAWQWQVFQRTGIVHLISISGSHITMLAGLAYVLAFWLWRRLLVFTWPGLMWLVLVWPAQRVATVASAFVAFVYVALAGFGVPAQRTLLMLLTVAWAMLFNLRVSATVLLTVALFVVSLIDPWAVLAPGFWLSFGAVGWLWYVGNARVGEVAFWRRWWRAQWAVAIGLAPVLLAFFGQLSLVSPLANVVAIPVVELLVTPLALLGSLTGIAVLVQMAHAVLALLVSILRELAAWPVWHQPAPDGWAVLLGTAGVAWLLLPRGVPARWLGTVCLLPLFWVHVLRPPPGGLWVDTLDVGQGLAVVLRTHQHNYLFDTGPVYGNGSDSGGRIIVPYLQGEGIEGLDTVVLSHDDNDHTGGAHSVLAAVPASHILTSLAAQNGVVRPWAARLVRCVTGESWQVDGVRFQVLHPDSDSYADRHLKDNNRSCVLKVSSAGGSVLLTADIEARDERQMLAAGEQVHADLLLAPHHGSHTSSTPAFIAAVRPRWVIFSVGAHNRFGHPHGDVVARYVRAGSQYWRSDRDGEVSVRFVPNLAPIVIVWRQKYRRYWQDDGREKSLAW